MRLLAGILSGRPGQWRLSGDRSLSSRPMRRVTDPLAEMGAQISSRDGTAPLGIQGASLRGSSFELPIASAQVKSAILLAGLQATGETIVEEPVKSRDHTERLLQAMDASISISINRYTVSSTCLSMVDINIPNDPSAAAFMATAAHILEGSVVCMPGVGSNPTRTGFFGLLARAGARVRWFDEVTTSGEPRATLEVTSGDRLPLDVDASTMPGAVDELPLVAVLGAMTEGLTVVSGAAELRVKESDRIDVLASGLRAMGVDIEATPDGFEIEGGPRPKGGCVVDGEGDHRMVMAFSVLALACQEPVVIRGASAAAVSHPSFFRDLAQITVPRGKP